MLLFAKSLLKVYLLIKSPKQFPQLVLLFISTRFQQKGTRWKSILKIYSKHYYMSCVPDHKYWHTLWLVWSNWKKLMPVFYHLLHSVHYFPKMSPMVVIIQTNSCKHYISNGILDLQCINRTLHNLWKAQK